MSTLTIADMDAAINEVKGVMGCIGGIQIIPSQMCKQRVDRQVRFPRSKKRRIQEKWKKDRGNYAPRMEQFALQYGNVIYMTSEAIDDLKLWSRVPFRLRKSSECLKALAKAERGGGE